MNKDVCSEVKQLGVKPIAIEQTSADIRYLTGSTVDDLIDLSVRTAIDFYSAEERHSEC